MYKHTKQQSVGKIIYRENTKSSYKIWKKSNVAHEYVHTVYKL